MTLFFEIELNLRVNTKGLSIIKLSLLRFSQKFIFTKFAQRQTYRKK